MMKTKQDLCIEVTFPHIVCYFQLNISIVDAALRTQRGVACDVSQHYSLLMEPVSCGHGHDYAS